MIVLMLMAVVLVAGLCVLAYTLAVYALPFMLCVEAAKWAYASGSGLIGAGLVGLIIGTAAYCLLVFAFTSLLSPIPRLIVALVFAAPAAVAGLCPRSRRYGRGVRGLAADILRHRRRLRRAVGSGPVGRLV